MAVPDFQSFFKPLLDFAADGNERSIQEARNAIASQISLPEEDMKELLPSGIHTRFDNPEMQKDKLNGRIEAEVKVLELQSPNKPIQGMAYSHR